MDASSSSNTANLISESAVDNKTKIGFGSGGGRKSEEVVADLVEVSSDEVSSDDLSLVDVEEDLDTEEEDSDEESDEEDEDDDEEEEDNERNLIFQDLWNLKKLAGFFHHPEMPVEVDGFAAGRNYFSRPEAADTLSEDEDEMIADALADARALKQLASAYAHPERPLEVDATACARNYFTQPWATEQETFGQAEGRARVVAESVQLKELAATYHHPEAPINMEPGTSMGRNYFLRPSGPEQMDDEQALILDEMKALKKSAADFMHPEKALEVSPVAAARNYFTRPSAPEQEEDEYADEREIILEEMKELKQAAVDFMHPEKPVELDTTGARSYFDRPSAEEQEDAEERELILKEMKAMKSLAVQFRHPEQPLVVDSTACGRNYFSRPSAEEQQEAQDEIMEELKALKSLAVQYRHPEQPLVVDSTACGRNYFSRPSAEEQEEDEYGDERAVVLEEMIELKRAATDFLHPERPLVMDATASARSYYDRHSAPEQDEDEEERQLILQEMQSLKKLAVDYLHPEKPIEIDATAFGRNYYSRASAPEQEEDEYCDDREIILEEMKELKQLSSDYLHPEKPLEMDATLFGRNYFSRPSAPEQEDEFDELILKDAAMLKQKAVDFMHPELPVSVDATAFGRNFYGRASAVDQESFAEAEQRALALAEAAKLKESAELYLHPEKPLEMDSTAVGRNYFSRPSAEDSDSDDDDDEERALVLEEIAQLKKLAVDFMHPERPVSVDAAAFGRNYFGRASAPSGEDFEEAEERNRVMEEARNLKMLASRYAHPEAPVESSVCGRNYFSRLSAPEQEALEESEERARVLAEASALKKLAMDYLHPEKSVETTDPTAVGRNYFARASAAGISENIHTSGHANDPVRKIQADEHSHHDDYGHFEMDEELFYDMRQSIVLPLASDVAMPKIQSSKLSSEEEGELSRSPSSVMLFTGALEDSDHPPLPTMG